MILATYAAGYHRLYRDDEEEINVVETESQFAVRTPQDMNNYLRHWWPCTLDFRTEAQRQSRTAVPVNNFDSIMREIRKHHNLDTVMWFGHATPGGEMQFGNSGVSFGPQGISSLQNSNVSQYFNSDGRIIIYGCNAGRNAAFAQSLANALRVRVCVFSRGIEWEIRWAPPQGRNRRIINRGVRGGVLPANPTCYVPQ